MRCTIPAIVSPSSKAIGPCSPRVNHSSLSKQICSVQMSRLCAVPLRLRPMRNTGSRSQNSSSENEKSQGRVNSSNSGSLPYRRVSRRPSLMIKSPNLADQTSHWGFGVKLGRRVQEDRPLSPVPKKNPCVYRALPFPGLIDLSTAPSSRYFHFRFSPLS